MIKINEKIFLLDPLKALNDLINDINNERDQFIKEAIFIKKECDKVILMYENRKRKMFVNNCLFNINDIEQGQKIKIDTRKLFL